MALSRENSEKLEKIIRLIEGACMNGWYLIDSTPTGEYGDAGFIFLSFAERFTFHLEGVQTLLMDLRQKPCLEASIGIIVRVCLLDFMTITYLTSYAFDDDEARQKKEPGGRMEKQVEMLMCDQLYNTLRYLKAGMEARMITREDYEQGVQAMWVNYPKFFKDDIVDFEDPASKLIHTNFVAPRKMFDRISSHAYVKRFAEVYDLYNWYSKYEHIGVMTHTLQRLDPNDQFLSLLTGIKYAVKGIQAAMSWSDGLVCSLAQQLNELEKIDDELASL